MNLRQSAVRSKEVLGAYFRQGLHELGAALYGPGTAAQHAEYGMLGTRTPGEVADGLRGSPSPQPAQEDRNPSVLDSYLHPSAARDARAHEAEPERDDRHVERD